jgi:SAM-dependent methyltransferase
MDSSTLPLETPPAPSLRTSDPFSHWRSLREGFAPLYCATVMREALVWLAPVLGPGRIAVDLGCGTGHAAEALAAPGGHAVGVDLDLPLLRETRRSRPARVLATARVEALPLADRSVDAVFCFSVLQYVDRGRALREMSRVLRPGGRFAVVENLRGNPVARAERAIRALLRRPYAGTFAPRRHPAWRERSDYLASFPATHFRAYHLCSPALLSAPSLARAAADTPTHAWTSRTLRMAERFDQFILNRLPVTVPAAWLLLATGEKP